MYYYVKFCVGVLAVYLLMSQSFGKSNISLGVSFSVGSSLCRPYVVTHYPAYCLYGGRFWSYPSCVCVDQPWVARHRANVVYYKRSCFPVVTSSCAHFYGVSSSYGFRRGAGSALPYCPESEGGVRVRKAKRVIYFR